MSEPLVLVVLLGTSVDPSAEAMLASVRRSLGPEATVLADTSDASSDTAALEIGERVRARAVARVVWADAESSVARLHVHVAPSAPSEWADQEIDFGPQDSTSEKGRTVGNALAAMVERIERDRESEPARPIEAAGPMKAPPSPPAAEAKAVDIFAVGVGALGHGSTAAGGAVGARWWIKPSLGLRLAAGTRIGSISEADATSTTLFAAAGPGYRFRLGEVELGARADFVVLRHAVTREGLVETTRSRWVGALDLVFEAGASLGSRAGVVLGVGPEVAFGSTAIDVGGVRRADIAPVRGVAELGLRIRL